MADSVRVTNLPDSGSPERVAFELYQDLRFQMPEEKLPYKEHVQRHLTLYKQCLNATTHRAIETSALT